MAAAPAPAPAAPAACVPVHPRPPPKQLPSRRLTQHQHHLPAQAVVNVKRLLPVVVLLTVPGVGADDGAGHHLRHGGGGARPPPSPQARPLLRPGPRSSSAPPAKVFEGAMPPAGVFLGWFGVLFGGGFFGRCQGEAGGMLVRSGGGTGTPLLSAGWHGVVAR